MLSHTDPVEKMPSVVRLNLGASLLALGFHGVLAVAQGIFQLCTALTPDQDRQQKLSRTRV